MAIELITISFRHNENDWDAMPALLHDKLWINWNFNNRAIRIGPPTPLHRHPSRTMPEVLTDRRLRRPCLRKILLRFNALLTCFNVLRNIWIT